MTEEKKEEKKKRQPGFKYVSGTKFCSKCGAKMATHKDRYSCGRCAYTEWKSKGQ